MKELLEKHRRLFGVIGASVAVVIAIIYLLVDLEVSPDAGGIEIFVLRYGHSICWLLLAGAIIMWVLHRTKWSTVLGYAALAVYGAFILTILLHETV